MTDVFNLKDPKIFETIWRLLAEKYKKEQKFSGKPEWQDGNGSMNLLGVRSNHEIAFNTKEDGFNNDMLFIWEKDKDGAVKVYEFNVTMDPLGKKPSIAHLIKGAWNSYVIGFHKWLPTRTAFRQDANNVTVARTDTNGKVIKYESGKFGINIHDSAGYKNSSLGCTILAKDDVWKNVFKPLLEKHKPLKKAYTYVVTDMPDVAQELMKLGINVPPKPFMDINAL